VVKSEPFGAIDWRAAGKRGKVGVTLLVYSLDLMQFCSCPKAPRRRTVVYALAAGLGTLNTQGITLEKDYDKHYASELYRPHGL
jgi:hypothetical protein